MAKHQGGRLASEIHDVVENAEKHLPGEKHHADKNHTNKHGAPEVTETIVREGTVTVETDPRIEAEIASREVIDEIIGDKEGDQITPTGIISESVVKEAKKPPRPKKSRAELEAEVNAARDDLGTTLDELVGKVYDLTPKNQVKKIKKTISHMALQTVADVKGFFAGEGMPADPERRKMVENVLKAAGGVGGLILLRAMLHGWRRQHTKHTIKKTARQAAKQAAEHTAKEHRRHLLHLHRNHEKQRKHGRKGGSVPGGNTTIIETGPIIEMIDPEFYE